MAESSICSYTMQVKRVCLLQSTRAAVNRLLKEQSQLREYLSRTYVYMEAIESGITSKF